MPFSFSPLVFSPRPTNFRSALYQPLRPTLAAPFSYSPFSGASNHKREVADFGSSPDLSVDDQVPPGRLRGRKNQQLATHHNHVRKPEKYEVIKEIGNDGEGPCTLMRRNCDGHLRVTKSVRSPIIFQDKPVEAKVLLDIVSSRHKNIIHLLDYEYLPEISLVQYHFEYCSGGDLFNLCERYYEHDACFPEAFIWKVFLQLTEALEFLHRPFSQDRLGIVHRDVKSANVFLRPSQDGSAYPDAVLADFGFATTEFATYGPGGTASYQPPEIPRKSPKGDVWSLGAIIHRMIHFAVPLLDLPSNIERCDAREEWWEEQPQARQPIYECPKPYSQQLITTMLIALELDLSKRVNSGRLLQILRAAMNSRYPPNSDSIRNPEPLAAWAFGNNIDSSSSPEKDSSTNKADGEGSRQYYEMMHRLWGVFI